MIEIIVHNENTHFYHVRNSFAEQIDWCFNQPGLKYNVNWNVKGRDTRLPCNAAVFSFVDEKMASLFAIRWS